MVMKKRYTKTAISQYLVVLMIVFAIIGLGLLSTILMKHIEFTDHFAIPWTAGRTWLLEGKSPYDTSIPDKAETAIAESGYSAVLPDEKLLLQPLINLFLYLPFSLIPYGISRAVYATISLLATGLVVFMALKLSGWNLSFTERIVIILLSTLWLPGAFSIINGQLTPILLAIILFSITLIMNGQDTTAGFLLAITFGSLFTSIFILLFITFWVIASRKWKVLKAYFAGLAFIIALSWLLLPSWFMDWLNLIIPKLQDTSWVRNPLMTFSGILPGIENFLEILNHSLLGVLLLLQLIMIFRKSEQKFVWRLFIIFIIAFLFNIQPSMAHLFLMLPAAFLIFRFWVERWHTFGRVLSFGVILLVTVGSWLLILPEVRLTQQDSSNILMNYLPIFFLVGMFWIRWWAFRIPKFETEN
jgi:hypothetical protein